MNACQVQSDSVWLILITVSMLIRGQQQPACLPANTLIMRLLHSADCAGNIPFIEFPPCRSLSPLLHPHSLLLLLMRPTQLMNMERIIHSITLPWKRCSCSPAATTAWMTRFQICSSSVRQETWQTTWWSSRNRSRGTCLLVSVMNEATRMGLMKIDSRFIVHGRRAFIIIIILIAVVVSSLAATAPPPLFVVFTPLMAWIAWARKGRDVE